MNSRMMRAALVGCALATLAWPARSEPSNEHIQSCVIELRAIASSKDAAMAWATKARDDVVSRGGGQDSEAAVTIVRLLEVWLQRISDDLAAQKARCTDVRP